MFVYVVLTAGLCIYMCIYTCIYKHHTYLWQDCLIAKFFTLILLAIMKYIFFITVLSFDSFCQRPSGNCLSRWEKNPFQLVVKLSEGKSLKYSRLPWEFKSRRKTISHQFLLILWSWTWLLLLIRIWLEQFQSPCRGFWLSLIFFSPLLPRCSTFLWWCCTCR